MMDNLVVDFPGRCAVSKKKAKVRNAAVSFSTSSQLHIIERINDKSEIWYSVQDYKAMNIAAKHAALMMNKQYRRSSSSRQHGRVVADASSSSSLGMDDRLTGIEHLISPSVIRAIKHRRAECSKAVLREQQRQVESGIYDPDSVAFASHSHSKHAAKRARAIGLLQSDRPEQDIKLADENIDNRGASSPTGVCREGLKRELLVCSGLLTR